jgi:folate-binding protein YgfZ
MNFSSQATVFWWRPAAWLRVTGGDAASFLQGQFTNDLRGVAPGAAVYGLWLNVKGKVVADSFVVRGAGLEEFWVGSYFSAAAAIRERLESFVIADDIVIEDQTAAWSAVSIFGEGEAAAIAATRATGFCFRGRRGHGEAWEWVFPAPADPEMRARFASVAELPADEVARRRIEAGVPAVPVDLGPGDLPNEGGLEAGAISYTKGCYLGQEVMARLKSMGQVRRKLVRVAMAVEKIPPLPAPLFLGTRQVGELRSMAPDGAGAWVGLAMVTLLHVAGGARLAFGADLPAEVSVVNL